MVSSPVTVLPGEDAQAFEDLWNEVWAELSPVGPIEELLLERIINSMWRLRRSARAETALFHWRVYWLKAGPAPRAGPLPRKARSRHNFVLNHNS
jgi:hypothetical protein